MGNWQLEIAKMAIYMAFPVTSFYVYHQVMFRAVKCLHCKMIKLQVDWFEDELTEIHKKVRTKDTLDNHKQIEECVNMMRNARDRKFKEELAKMKEEVGILSEKQ